MAADKTLIWPAILVKAYFNGQLEKLLQSIENDTTYSGAAAEETTTYRKGEQ